MIRWILSLFCFCYFLSIAPPVMAQEADLPAVTQQKLQKGEEIAQKALNAAEKGDFATAEEYWTELTEEFPTNPAVWSNRGNTRVGQNRLAEAIADFDKSIELAPDAADPYLNRGAAYEGQGRWQEALADYEKVLSIAPEEPLAYNNRGNAKAGQGRWEEALQDYKKAADMSPDFAFARANYALTAYQTDRQEEAVRTMRNLVRKYPMFPDMRAALTAVLWQQGQQGEAESNWVAAVGIDNRYQDIDWVKNIRRWPPKMVVALEKFLNLE